MSPRRMPDRPAPSPQEGEIGVLRVGVCVLELRLGGVTSLKGKRGVVQSIKERLKHRYNVSVAEVDCQDLHQRAALGIAMAGNDARRLNSELDKLVDAVERMHLADVIGHRIEVL